MTKYNKLALTGGLILGISAIFMLLVSYFIIIGPTHDSQPVNTVQKRDTVIVERVVTVKPDTIIVFKPCKRKHCEEAVAVSTVILNNDSSQKNQTSNGN